MSCDNKLKKECFTELETFISGIQDKNGALISVLHKAQEIFGYLPQEVQTFVAVQTQSCYSYLITTKKEGNFSMEIKLHR